MSSESPPPQAGTNVSAAAAPLPEDDSWTLEADRLAIQSPLVEALRLLAGHYGRRTSRSSLTSGLPIPKGGITPDLFIRAAGRADLHAKLIERSLAALAITPNLPCILVLENKQACILWDVKPAKAKGGETLFRSAVPGNRGRTHPAADGEAEGRL